MEQESIFHPAFEHSPARAEKVCVNRAYGTICASKKCARIEASEDGSQQHAGRITKQMQGREEVSSKETSAQLTFNSPRPLPLCHPKISHSLERLYPFLWPGPASQTPFPYDTSLSSSKSKAQMGRSHESFLLMRAELDVETDVHG